MYVFDIHCHILPKVDDGSKDMEMSIKMIDIAYSQGIRKMILTPHFYLGKTKNRGEIDARYKQLLDEVSKKYEDMQLYPGNEVLWEDGVIEALKQGEIYTMAGSKYVLTEFLPSSSYNEIYGAVRKITMAGYRPIIAHMERYANLVHDLDCLEELRRNGACFQMNASSLVGGLFDREAMWCRKLVKNGYISFLGTDAHNLDERGPYVKDAVDIIRKKLDAKELEDLLYGNGEKLLEGKRI